MVRIYSCMHQWILWFSNFDCRDTLPQKRSGVLAGRLCGASARAGSLKRGQRVIKQQKERVICINEHLLAEQGRRKDTGERVWMEERVQVLWRSLERRANKEIGASAALGKFTDCWNTKERDCRNNQMSPEPCFRILTGQINRFIASEISSFASLGRILGIVLYILHRAVSRSDTQMVALDKNISTEWWYEFFFFYTQMIYLDQHAQDVLFVCFIHDLSVDWEYSVHLGSK